MFKFTDTKALSDEGAWVHIKEHGRKAYWPDDKGWPDKSKPIRIKVLGEHSETYREAARKRSAKLVKDRSGSLTLEKMSIGEIEDLIERGENAKAEDWADRTIDWENVPSPDGTPLEFSRENALMIYTGYPKIIAQLEHDAGEIDDFLALISVD